MLSDPVARRIVESPLRFTGMNGTGAPLSLSELYDTVQDAIWSELRTASEIDPLRRNLQREHLKRLVASMIRPSYSVHADARSLQRENARRLLAQVQGRAGEADTVARNEGAPRRKRQHARGSIEGAVAAVGPLREPATAASAERTGGRTRRGGMRRHEAA